MKKLALIAAVALALPLSALAQQAAPAKPAAKPAATKKAPPKKQITRRAAKAVEEVTPIAEDPNLKLDDAQLAIAQRIHTGKIQCELGADVTVTADEKKPGFFTVSTKGAKYRMHPVESRTGAIRLEDPRAGALWLQLGNKSMLMSQKQGQRLADECQSPAQLTFADEMKKNPPVSILDPLPKPAAAASQAK